MFTMPSGERGRAVAAEAGVVGEPSRRQEAGGGPTPVAARGPEPCDRPEGIETPIEKVGRGRLLEGCPWLMDPTVEADLVAPGRQLGDGVRVVHAVPALDEERGPQTVAVEGVEEPRIPNGQRDLVLVARPHVVERETDGQVIVSREVDRSRVQIVVRDRRWPARRRSTSAGRPS